ncbi:hypothetical protein M8J76_013347 [Diaphorina citri]|nr:hypothetical protein M8J76_013347 [Diaphorina citri]
MKRNGKGPREIIDQRYETSFAQTDPRFETPEDPAAMDERRSPNMETAPVQPSTGEQKESCVIEYLRYFQSMFCARSLPDDDGDLCRKPYISLCKSLRRSSKDPPKNNAEQQTGDYVPVFYPGLDMGDNNTITTIDSATHMNAWSQIYYDITRYDPQTQTRVSIPEVFVAPVTVPPKLFDTITQETRTVTIDSFQFKSVQERQTSVSPTKIVRSIQEEAARFPPTVLNASNKSVHEEKHKIVGDHHANYTYKFEYGEEHQQGDNGEHHSKHTRKHLNSLGSNMLCLVNQAKHQAQEFFGSKMKHKSMTKHATYCEEPMPMLRRSNCPEWYNKYGQPEKNTFHMEIRPRRAKPQKLKDSSLQNGGNTKGYNCKSSANLNRLRRKIKKRQIELEELRKSIQKEAKGVCCELKKFRDDEKQQTKEQKLKEKQENNEKTALEQQDQTQDNKTKLDVQTENYKELLRKFSLVEEECRIFHGIYRELQDQRPKIVRLRDQSMKRRKRLGKKEVKPNKAVSQI